MLALPRPPEGEPSAGLPVVQLSDSHQDLRHLLRALLPSARPMFYRYTAGNERIPAAMLSAVIRLSHKYGFTELENQGLACLKTYYTLDFNVWQGVNRGDTRTPFPLFELSPIEVIHIARLTNTPSLLPVAFYRCVMEEAVYSELVHGHTRQDGTLVQLDAADVLRCLTGQRALVNRSLQAFTSLFAIETSERCEEPARCERIIKDLREEMEHFFAVRNMLFAPLDLWWHAPYREGSPQGRWPENELCARCFQRMKVRDREEREAMRVELPWTFDVFIPPQESCPRV